MSLIQRNSSMVKFYGITYCGTFNPDTDLDFMRQMNKMVAFRTMLNAVLCCGFENGFYLTMLITPMYPGQMFHLRRY